MIKIDLSPKDERVLADLGLIKGVSLTFLKQAPLGDPIMIKISNFTLALRKSTASKIYVEKI